MRRLFYKQDDCAKEYKIGETLGKGSFATVKHAICRADESQWAVKIIDKTKLDKEDEDALKVEVDILQTVQHPNIVVLRQVYDTPKVFYMVMELMTGGELFDRIVEKEKYTEAEASAVVFKLAGAIKYCHDMGIVHRDLKPENLLYASKSPDSDIKIADFGLAKLLKESDMMATACGTPGYVAPEILQGGPYTDKVDIWSLGVITYILLCGFPPFYDENNAVLFSQIKAGAFDFPSPYWDGVSATAKDFILKLLVVDPTRRLTAQQMLEHPWVAAYVSPAPDAAPAPDLRSALTELRRFNGKRKLKAHIRAAQAVRAFSAFGKLSLSERLVAAARAADDPAAAAAGTPVLETGTSPAALSAATGGASAEVP